ncbi:ribulose-phosphate 3-epimerase, partial [Klebsiella pneumoniae]
PKTPVSSLVMHLNYLDQILIMSVNPGFGGQSFLPDTPKRIKQVDQLIKSNLSSISIEVDGGVNDQNIILAASTGCNIFV